MTAMINYMHSILYMIFFVDNNSASVKALAKSSN